MRRFTLFVLITFGALVVAYPVVPDVAAAAAVLLGLTICVSVVRTVRRRSLPLPWRLLAFGLAASCLSDVIYGTTVTLDPSAVQSTSWLPGLVWIASSAALLAGAVLIVVRRAPTAWRAGLLDGLALWALVAGLMWIFVAVPAFAEPGPLLDRATPSVLALFDTIVFGALAGIMLTSVRRPRSLVTLLAFLGSWIVIDASISLLIVHGASDYVLALTRGMILMSYLLLDVAVHQPDAAEVVERQPEVTSLSPARAALLVLTLALLPLLLFIGAEVSGTWFVWVGSVVVGVVGLATALRFGALVRDLTRARHELNGARDRLHGAQSELYRRATYDSLTGLANRGRVIDVLEDLLAHAPNEVAILYLDLDGFKRVNDTLGHAGGDALLKAAAGRLTSRLRDSATIGRIGGDEFLVVAPVDGKTSARSLASRLSGCFAEPYHVEQQLVHVGVSIGLVVVERGTPIDQAMRRADLAMYAAKRGGGGAVDADALEAAT